MFEWSSLSYRWTEADGESFRSCRMMGEKWWQGGGDVDAFGKCQSLWRIVHSTDLRTCFFSFLSSSLMFYFCQYNKYSMYLYFVQLGQERWIAVHRICTVRQQPTLFLTLTVIVFWQEWCFKWIITVKEDLYTFLLPFHTLMLIAGSRNVAMWLNGSEEVDCSLGKMDADNTDFKLGFSKLNLSFTRNEICLVHLFDLSNSHTVFW